MTPVPAGDPSGSVGVGEAETIPIGGIGSANDDGSPAAIESRLWMLAPFLRMRALGETPLVADQVADRALEDARRLSSR